MTDTAHPATRTYIGIYPSFGGAALVALPERGRRPLAVRLVRAGRIDWDLRRYEAYSAVIAGALRHVQHGGAPALIAIDGHNPKGRERRHADLIELGALVREHILARGLPLVEVPPATLARFIAGRADLSGEIIPAVEAAFDHTAATAPEAYACALAHAARCLRDPSQYPGWRTQALGVTSAAATDAARHDSVAG